MTNDEIAEIVASKYAKHVYWRTCSRCGDVDRSGLELNYRAAILEALSMRDDGWVSVEDRLPDSERDGDFVYVVWNEDQMGRRLPAVEGDGSEPIAMPCGIDVCFVPYLIDVCGGLYTHWKPLGPLPSAPEVKRG